MTTRILQSSCASVSHERPPDLPSREVLPAAQRITGVDLAVAVGVKRLQPNRTSTPESSTLRPWASGGRHDPISNQVLACYTGWGQDGHCWQQRCTLNSSSASS